MDIQLGPRLDLTFVSLEQLLTIVLLILIILFMVHSAIVTYHWLTYAQNRSQAFVAALVHIGIGGIILATMAGIIIF